MKQIIFQLILLSLGVRVSVAQIGQFQNAADIGNPKVKGSTVYDSETQTYTMKGGGANIWFNHDEFQFLYRKIKGDFLLTANFEMMGNENGNSHRKTGWMIRETTDDDSVSINACVHGDGLAVLQWRLMRGAYMRDPEDELFFPKQYSGEYIIQLERVGKQITMRIAHPLEPLEDMGSITLPELKDEVLIGPYVLPHDETNMQEARVWNVRVSTPVPPDWHPNRQIKVISHKNLMLGSRLETLDVATGKRKVIYQSNDRMLSPMFSPDGREIRFEMGGAPYAVSVLGGVPKNSSAASTADKPETSGQYMFYTDNQSGTRQVWRQRVDGSDPQQLTYDLEHAWFPHLSPDEKWLVYLACPHDANPQKPAAYQRVSLKLMPVAGGAPRTIAHLFGGEGSLENPCWSPDGSQIVFVSNSETR